MQPFDRLEEEFHNLYAEDRFSGALQERFSTRLQKQVYIGRSGHGPACTLTGSHSSRIATIPAAMIQQGRLWEDGSSKACVGVQIGWKQMLSICLQSVLGFQNLLHRQLRAPKIAFMEVCLCSGTR